MSLPLSHAAVPAREMRILLREEASLTPDEDRAVRRLLSASFPHRLTFRWRRYLITAPARRWLAHGTEGRLAGHAALFLREIGTGAGPVRIGGVAQVCVAPEWRGRGLSRLILGEIHVWLRERGVPFALLFGRPEFYRSSGYRPVSNPVRADNALARRWNPLRRSLMVCPLGALPWPEGVIDLNGPSF